MELRKHRRWRLNGIQEVDGSIPFGSTRLDDSEPRRTKSKTKEMETPRRVIAHLPGRRRFWVTDVLP